MQVANWQLLKHPLNWFIVVLMLLIAGIAGHYVLTLAGLSPATNSNS